MTDAIRYEKEIPLKNISYQNENCLRSQCIKILQKLEPQERDKHLDDAVDKLQQNIYQHFKDWWAKDVLGTASGGPLVDQETRMIAATETPSTDPSIATPESTPSNIESPSIATPSDNPASSSFFDNELWSRQYEYHYTND